MSSYSRAAPPHHNYELFSIVRLVGLNQLIPNTGGDDKEKHKRGSISKAQGVEGIEPNRVVIQYVAAGGYVDHSFVAMALSNDTLIFRFVGDSGVPLVRQMPWTFKDQYDKRVVGMAFNPTAQWLMVLAADATVVLVPIYFLMCKKGMNDFEEKAAPIVVNEKERFERLSSLISSPSSWFGKMTGQPDSNTASNGRRKLNDVTVITLGTAKQLDATHCVWWKTWNGGDYGIIATQQGTIIIVNFFNEEVQYKHKIKFPVVRITNRLPKPIC